MRYSAVGAFVLLLAHGATAGAATFTFATDPFAGSTAPTTPGRQIVGGEDFITFDPATDVFAIDPAAFAPHGFTPPLSFVNGAPADVPASGANFIVLPTGAVTPMAGGTAANLIAAQVTSPGAGFFIYFNTGLDMPRLVFSADLDDPAADLKILARMTNLVGQPESLGRFTEANVTTAVPEPGVLSLLAVALGVGVRQTRRR